MRIIITGALWSALLLAVAGCSSSNERDEGYKRSGSVRPLEMPPNLLPPKGAEPVVVPELKETPEPALPVPGE